MVEDLGAVIRAGRIGVVGATPRLPAASDRASVQASVN